MYTYNNTYYTTTTTVDTEALAAVLGVTSVIALIMLIIMVIANWKIFTKAGKPGWASIVPFYNMYTLFEVAGMNGWMFLSQLSTSLWLLCYVSTWPKRSANQTPLPLV